MTWPGTPSSPPPGWELAVLRDGDRLSRLEGELGVRAEMIAEANGVVWPGRKTCTWSRDLDEWVLATGGVREPVVSGSPNACAPDLGFTAFGSGQQIYLPVGARPRAGAAAAATASLKRSPLLWGLGALLLLAAAAAGSRSSR